MVSIMGEPVRQFDRTALRLNGEVFVSCVGGTEIKQDHVKRVQLRTIQPDLPPEAPSFITRVCGFGFHILRRQFEQARRMRSPQIAQALGALQRVFGCPEMSAV